MEENKQRGLSEGVIMREGGEREREDIMLQFNSHSEYKSVYLWVGRIQKSCLYPRKGLRVRASGNL